MTNKARTAPYLVRHCEVSNTLYNNTFILFYTDQAAHRGTIDQGPRYLSAV